MYNKTLIPCTLELSNFFLEDKRLKKNTSFFNRVLRDSIGHYVQCPSVGQSVRSSETNLLFGQSLIVLIATAPTHATGVEYTVSLINLLVLAVKYRETSLLRNRP
jgi:hypothetical protein